MILGAITAGLKVSLSTNKIMSQYCDPFEGCRVGDVFEYIPSREVTRRVIIRKILGNAQYAVENLYDRYSGRSLYDESFRPTKTGWRKDEVYTRQRILDHYK